MVVRAAQYQPPPAFQGVGALGVLTANTAQGVSLPSVLEPDLVPILLGTGSQGQYNTGSGLTPSAAWGSLQPAVMVDPIPHRGKSYADRPLLAGRAPGLAEGPGAQPALPVQCGNHKRLY